MEHLIKHPCKSRVIKMLAIATVLVFNGIKNIESLTDERTNMLATVIFYAVYYVWGVC